MIRQTRQPANFDTAATVSPPARLRERSKIVFSNPLRQARCSAWPGCVCAWKRGSRTADCHRYDGSRRATSRARAASEQPPVAFKAPASDETSNMSPSCSAPRSCRMSRKWGARSACRRRTDSSATASSGFDEPDHFWDRPAASLSRRISSRIMLSACSAP